MNYKTLTLTLLLGLATHTGLQAEEMMNHQGHDMSQMGDMQQMEGMQEKVMTKGVISRIDAGCQRDSRSFGSGNCERSCSLQKENEGESGRCISLLSVGSLCAGSGDLQEAEGTRCFDRRPSERILYR